MTAGYPRLFFSLALALSFAPRPLCAQSAAAIAEGLYRDGQKLLDQKKYAEACPKLAESERIEPAGGTELALALCYDEWGKIASAWAAYRDALASARKNSRKDREKAASDAIKRLEPQLPRLTVQLSPEAALLPGLEVRRDGVVLGKVAWGTPIPTDPGEISIEASAPGYQPFLTTAKIAGPRDEKTILIPSLVRFSTPPAASSTPPAPAASSAKPAATPAPTPIAPPVEASKPTLGYVALGVGVVGVGVGAYLGSRFFSKKADADAICPGSTCSDRHAVDLSEQAQLSGILGSASLAVGLAGVGVGSYLLFFRSRPAAPTVAILPLQNGAAALLTGRY